MSLHIVLDSSLLAALSKPSPAADIVRWVRTCELAGHEIYVPKIIDYELRRQLIRAQKRISVTRLDRHKTTSRFLPITSAAMVLAANLWAMSRLTGLPTGDAKKLDIDVVLAAQALTLGTPQREVIGATTNVRHLSRFVAAAEWQDIKI